MKERMLDQKFCGTARGQVGPVERRLASYSRVFVVGYYGELSKDASELLAFAAEEIAARTWETEAAGASLASTTAQMTRRLHQNWGVISVREVASSSRAAAG